jgi:hypothetical protein
VIIVPQQIHREWKPRALRIQLVVEKAGDVGVWRKF